MGSVFGARGAHSFLYKLTAVLAIGFLLATDGDGDLPGGGRDDGETVVIKDYKLSATATIKSIKDTDPYVSSLRVNFGGAQRKKSIEFFKYFFTAIDKSLFLDDSIESVLE